MTRRTGKRRLVRVLALGAALLLVVLVVAALTRGAWGPPAARAALRRFAGIEASVGALEGSFWSGIAARDLVLRGGPGRPELEELAIDELELGYDLRALAAGDLA